MELNTFAYSPAQLFILDTSDPVVEGWFTEDEWDDIIGRVSTLPDVDEILVDSFKRFYSVETTTMLRNVLGSGLIPCDATYDKNLHHNSQRTEIAILKFLPLLEAPNNPLIQPHLEGWYGYNIWSHILDAGLLDLQGRLTVERKEGACRATAMSRNSQRKMLTERLKPGPRHDGIIHSLGDDHHEYGGIEDGRSFAGGVKATKWIKDNFKLIKSLLHMQVVGKGVAGKLPESVKVFLAEATSRQTFCVVCPKPSCGVY